MTHLNILQYNIRARPRLLFFWDRVVERLEYFLNYLSKELNFLDLIVLNEIFDSKTIEITTNFFREKGWYVSGSTMVTVTTGGVIIASKWPIICKAEDYYINCDLSDCLSCKGPCYVKIQHPKFLFNIIGTHLQDIDSDVKNTRRAQIKQLKEFINTLPFKKNEPFFLIGDFNICPFKEDELYNYFKKKLKAESIRAQKQTHIDNYLLDYILKLYPKNKSYDYNVRVFNLMDDKGYPVSDHSIVYTSVNIT